MNIKCECKDICDIMRVKPSEICTNGPWRMRTGHANGMRWIPGRCAVAHVEMRKTRECKIREMRENAKPARYASARMANCVGSRDVHNSWDARKREESEREVRERRENVKCVKYAKCETRDICEMRNMRYMRDAKHAIYARCETRDICEMRNARYMRDAQKCETCKNARCAETQKRKNTKIAKVAALQQVQYKVLLYGLYAPIETWVSTTRHWDGRVGGMHFMGMILHVLSVILNDSLRVVPESLVSAELVNNTQPLMIIEDLPWQTPWSRSQVVTLLPAAPISWCCQPKVYVVRYVLLPPTLFTSFPSLTCWICLW
jgi:hypothetical protein